MRVQRCVMLSVGIGVLFFVLVAAGLSVLVEEPLDRICDCERCRKRRNEESERELRK
jgi:hypothetical protein